MRTKYFKIARPEIYWDEAIYIKIAGNDKGASRTWLVGNMIDLTNHDSYEDAVESIENNSMPKEKLTVVEREEYDLYYKRFVEKLNQISVL